ncbi:Methyltransferase small domain protein [Rhodopirellula maiorica SM1]|uniref:Methyltransferase small domain protein n=1 Tax=Rhodopirellula maiorica SM1 TaxID=1265738 RepID=M5RGP4_9BACT|nr:Methyltransferase small domain protein [Rhodopirellula maiorica SM1]
MQGETMRILKTLFLMWLAVSFCGCSREYRDDLDYSYGVVQTWPMESLLFGDLVQFESVPLDLDETESLRKLIIDDSIAANRNVLEVGTGTGLIAILCLQNEASRVVAIDWNPAAVANARYNAAALDSEANLEVRPTGRKKAVFSGVQEKEKFDLVIVNFSDAIPPVVAGNEVAKSEIDDHDVWRDALLDQLKSHLSVGGRCLFIVHDKQAITRLVDAAEGENYQTKVLDSRDWETLEREIRPSMVVEIRVAANAEIVAEGEFISPPSTQ